MLSSFPNKGPQESFRLEVGITPFAVVNCALSLSASFTEAAFFVVLSPSGIFTIIPDLSSISVNSKIVPRLESFSAREGSKFTLCSDGIECEVHCAKEEEILTETMPLQDIHTSQECPESSLTLVLGAPPSSVSSRPSSMPTAAAVSMEEKSSNAHHAFDQPMQTMPMLLGGETMPMLLGGETMPLEIHMGETKEVQIDETKEVQIDETKGTDFSLKATQILEEEGNPPTPPTAEEEEASLPTAEEELDDNYSAGSDDHLLGEAFFPIKEESPIPKLEFLPPPTLPHETSLPCSNSKEITSPPAVIPPVIEPKPVELPPTLELKVSSKKPDVELKMAENATKVPETIDFPPIVAKKSRVMVFEQQTNTKPEVDFSTLKIDELRSQLKSRGLDSKGNKSALVSRLKSADALAQSDFTFPLSVPVLKRPQPESNESNTQVSESKKSRLILDETVDNSRNTDFVNESKSPNETLQKHENELSEKKPEEISVNNQHEEEKERKPIQNEEQDDLLSNLKKDTSIDTPSRLPSSSQVEACKLLSERFCKVRILFTSYKPSPEQLISIANLGGEQVEDLTQVTHVVLNKGEIRRTLKFLRIMAKTGPLSPRIVTTDWLEKSLKQKHWIANTEDFFPFEGNVNLRQALSLRDNATRGLFSGLTFLTVAAVEKNMPIFEELLPIVKEAGGQLVLLTRSSQLKGLDPTKTLVIGNADSFSNSLTKSLKSENYSWMKLKWLFQCLTSYSLEPGTDVSLLVHFGTFFTPI